MKPERWVPAADQTSAAGLEFGVKPSPDGTRCVISIGLMQLELPRSEVVRLAQTLLAMAGVMRDA